MLVSTPTSSPSSWLHPPVYLSSHPYACGPGWTPEAGVDDEGLPCSPAFVSHLAPDHSEDVRSTRIIWSSGPLSPFRVFRRWFLDAREVTVRWWVFPKQIIKLWLMVALSHWRSRKSSSEWEKGNFSGRSSVVACSNFQFNVSVVNETNLHNWYKGVQWSSLKVWNTSRKKNPKHWKKLGEKAE